MSEASNESDRPVVSTRDPEELRRRLEAWVGERLPVDAQPAISSLRTPERNGMSSETVLFDLDVSEDGQRSTRPYVARLAPESSAVPVFPTYDFDKQFRVMQLVASETTVPIPHTPWFEPDSAAVGSPFFVMERIEGEVPPDLLPYNFGDSWLFSSSRDEQARLQASTVRALAQLHAIDIEANDVSFLELDRSEATPLRRHMADQWEYYKWVSGDRPQPLIESIFAWLEANWPDEESATVLCWGDSRIGNVLYRDFEPVAVLDWEMAGLAPRELDVAWMVFLHRFFEDLAGLLGLPGMPDFMRLDEVVATYEAASGYTPQNMRFYLMYAALRHGIVMTRVQQRSIHFGEAAMPDDPDDLIMHRSTLEQMLDGSYWSKL
jgi:aminoglycoside phosphotransferase (APT) family kinase protein